MRVTGGHLKGRIIPTQFANHVRPSTDRVRESLFNSIEHQKGIADTTVLDLFSGSGIIALEFLTRDAQAVYSIDLDKKNIAHQKHIAKSWDLHPWHIATGNALTPITTLAKNRLPGFEVGESSSKLENQSTGLTESAVPILFDIIFDDPPYDMPNIQGLPQLLMPLLAPDGWLIIEHKPQLVFAEQEFAKKEYGSTTMTIFVQE
ncbi:MAG: RsmD family RNA methyltransferase [Bacteroidota bacterium]